MPLWMRREAAGVLSAACFLLLAVAGCAPSAPDARSSCLLPSQKPTLVAELFFGRDIPGRQPLTEAEWSDFAARVVTREFPAGFTTFDGAGQWRDPQTGEIVREPTKIVIAALEPAPDVQARLEAVISAYRRAFDQRSVGLVTSSGCGAF